MTISNLTKTEIMYSAYLKGFVELTFTFSFYLVYVFQVRLILLMS